MKQKFVYLMRGLPSSGKSHLAKRLAGDDGVIVETDAYFHNEGGPGANEKSLLAGKSNEQILVEARQWNWEQFQNAIKDGKSPIVVDRGNGLTFESYKYVKLALEQRYEVQIKEPDSEWWREIRVLLKYKEYTKPVLDVWADKLAQLNSATHGVKAEKIRELMDAWQDGITIEDILNFGKTAYQNTSK